MLPALPAPVPCPGFPQLWEEAPFVCLAASDFLRLFLLRAAGTGRGAGGSCPATLGPHGGHGLVGSLGLLPRWLVCFVPQFPCLGVGTVP